MVSDTRTDSCSLRKGVREGGNIDSKLFYDYVAQNRESRAKAVPEVVKLQEEVYWNLKEFCIGLINILENIAQQ